MMCTTQKRYVCELPWGGGGGGENFNYLPQRGEDYENLKRGGSMVREQDFLKGGLALFLFIFVKVYHVYI